MKTLLKSLLLFATAGLLASCQAPSSTPDSVVMCGKCKTVWFKAPVTAGVGGAGLKSGIVAYRTAGTMTCPDCENAVVAMLKGGNITKHVCKTCGSTLQHCKAH